MAWSFNPFTGNLDLTGSSGAVVFEGEVETFADLSETIGDPPVGSSYLVRTSTGVWLVNKRQSGIWIRRNNTGVRATDWEYGGDYPVNSVAGKTGNVTLTNSDISGLGSAATADLNAISDADLRIVGSTDATKKVAIEVDSLVSAGTTRTITVPNKNVTLDDASDARTPLYHEHQTFDEISSALQDNIEGIVSLIGAAPLIHTHAAADVTSGVFDNARVNFAAPAAIGSTTPAAATFTNLTANTRVNLPNTNGTTAGDLYRNADTLRYRDSSNTERLLLNATDNLANLSNTTAARSNLGLGSAATSASTDFAAASHNHAAADITSGVLNNARINFASPSAIGSTTAAAITGTTGTFSTLSANNGTITASAPVLDLSQTWNNAAATFTGIRLNVTNTASGGSSLLLDLQTGGSSQFSVRRDGLANTGLAFTCGTNTSVNAAQGIKLRGDFSIEWSSTGFTFDSSRLIVVRDADDVLAVRRTTNPQTFRLYNTFTDNSNYERGFMRWSSNVLQIGTEKGGTGSARNLQFLTDNSTRLTIDTSGNVGINVSAPERPFHISGSSMWARFDRVGSVGPAIMMVRQATLGSTNSSWLLGSPNTAGVSNEDFALIDYGVNISGTVGTPRITIAKSDGQLTVNGNLNLSTKDLVTDTTTGTKIGTGTTQKLGFFNATPIVRPAAIADATDAATTQARLNDLLAAMRSLGLIAT